MVRAGTVPAHATSLGMVGSVRAPFTGPIDVPGEVQELQVSPGGSTDPFQSQ